MASPGKTALSPRKKPSQARSKATVDAIFEATIQVLLVEGLQRLTTIRVAERAGTSVGTLYQYYPNKQVLLHAVLQRHIQGIGERFRTAAASVHHTPLATIVSTIVAAYVEAKTERIDESRALYAVASSMDFRELATEAEERGREVLVAVLETATDARFDDMGSATFLFMATLIGPMTFLIERGAEPSIVRAWSAHLQSLCLNCLERAASSSRDAVD